MTLAFLLYLLSMSGHHVCNTITYNSFRGYLVPDFTIQIVTNSDIDKMPFYYNFAFLYRSSFTVIFCGFKYSKHQRADQTHYVFFLSTGNGVGDACENDLDKDGVPDSLDACSCNKNVKKTDFRSDFKIALDPKGQAQIDPVWRVFDEVNN